MFSFCLSNYKYYLYYTCLEIRVLGQTSTLIQISTMGKMSTTLETGDRAFEGGSSFLALTYKRVSFRSKHIFFSESFTLVSIFSISISDLFKFLYITSTSNISAASHAYANVCVGAANYISRLKYETGILQSMLVMCSNVFTLRLRSFYYKLCQALVDGPILICRLACAHPI